MLKYFCIQITSHQKEGGLWVLKPLSTLFQLYRGGQYIMMEKTGVPGENRNTVYREKPPISRNFSPKVYFIFDILD